MADLSLIQYELKNVMGMSEEETRRFEPIIKSASAYIEKLLISYAERNTVPAVHLCAARAYYQILLLKQEEEVTSFKAGDVSYTRASSALDNARKLYESALQQCSGMIKNGETGFAFKVV